MQRNCSSLTRASEIMVLHFFQQIMCYFLPNYVQKSWIMHKLQKIFKQKFSFFSMHWACKSSLVLLLIQNYPFSKQNTGKKVLPPNKSHQGAFFFSKLWSVILIFFQSWQVLYKKLFVNTFCSKAVATFYKNAPCLLGKNFQASLKVAYQ